MVLGVLGGVELAMRDLNVPFQAGAGVGAAAGGENCNDASAIFDGADVNFLSNPSKRYVSLVPQLTGLVAQRLSAGDLVVQVIDQL